MRKNLRPSYTNEKQFWTDEVPTRKKYEPTMYPLQEMLDPRSTHEKNFQTHEIPTRKNSEPTTV